MIYISKDRQIHVVWSIFRGTSDVHEDFSRALVKVFLIGNYEKYLLEAVAEGGNLVFDIPQGLPEGAYSLEAIWVKNYNNLLPCSDTLTPSVDSGCRNQPLRWPFKHPHDHRFNDRCIMRSRKDFVFALTEYDSESTFYKDSGEAEIKIRSAVATYGYDGLSAYEIAVLRGDFNGTEGEYLDSLKFKLEVAQEHKLGGITAVTKTDDETEEVKVDPETGRLYVKPGGGSLSVATETKLGGIKAASKTDNETVEAKIGSDGKLYVPKGGEELKTATETTLGGIKAATKTSLDTQEVKIDPVTGKLYTQPGGEGGVEIVNNPDEEDLHSIEKSANVHVLQFADKEYNASSFSGLGRVYLRKNISDGKNVLTQAMMNKANTRYIIQYDYDLDGETITMPEGCTLEFEGGSLKNGNLTGTNTFIKSGDNAILYDIELSGSFIGIFDSAWIGGDNIDYGEKISNVFPHYNKVNISRDIHIISPINIAGEYTLDIGGKTIFVDSNVNGINITGIPTVKNGTVKVSSSEYSSRAISIVSNGDGIFKASLCLSNIKTEGIESRTGYGIVMEALTDDGTHDGFLAFRTLENIYISNFETGLYLKCGYGEQRPYTPYINSNIFNNITFSDTLNCIIAEVVKETSLGSNPGGEINANVFNTVTVQALGDEQESIIIFKGQVARNIINNLYIWDLFSNSKQLLQLDQWSVNNLITSNIFDNSVPSTNIKEVGHDDISYANNIRKFTFPSNINPTFLGSLNLAQTDQYGLAPSPSQRFKGIKLDYSSEGDSNDMCIYPYGTGRSGIRFFVFNNYSDENQGKEALEINFDGFIIPKGFTRFSHFPFIPFTKSEEYSPTYNGEVYFSDTFKCLTTNYNGNEYLQDGYRALARKGDSSSRPTLYDVDAGFRYFDTTLNKPIYWTGSKWVDAMGSDV